MRSGEFSTIERLGARFARGAGAGVEVGIGDDAAVLTAPAGQLVWTVDAQVERTHFARNLASWEDVGYRSFMAAASDLAAMSADPWCALTALVLDADLLDEDVDAIARGQELASAEAQARIVGGNLSRGEVVSITTTLLGCTDQAIRREGAREGDDVWIAGPVGLAAAGLVALQRTAFDPALDVAVSAWLRPLARLDQGRAMRGRAHAAIDVSDGLAQDLGHLARASGLRAVLDAEMLLELAEASGLCGACDLLGLDPMSLMLHGGEDYALVAASDLPLAGFVRAGTFVRGEGVALRDEAGGEQELTPHGFDHFAR